MSPILWWLIILYLFRLWHRIHEEKCNHECKCWVKEFIIWTQEMSNLHIWRPERCQGLKVNENLMNNKTYDTYLGDVVSSSGNNNLNISHTVTRGISAVIQIVSMINQVSLGKYYFDIALFMRETTLNSLSCAQHLIDFSKLDYQMVFQNINRQEIFAQNYNLL